MGFSRQEYRSELLFPSPGDLPNPGNKPESPELQETPYFFLTAEPPGKPAANFRHTKNLLKKQLPHKSLNWFTSIWKNTSDQFWIPIRSYDSINYIFTLLFRFPGKLLYSLFLFYFPQYNQDLKGRLANFKLLNTHTLQIWWGREWLKRYKNLVRHTGIYFGGMWHNLFEFCNIRIVLHNLVFQFLPITYSVQWNPMLCQWNIMFKSGNTLLEFFLRLFYETLHFFVRGFVNIITPFTSLGQCNVMGNNGKVGFLASFFWILMMCM